MSQIDTVFQSIPAPLLKDWGQTITYIKTSTPRTYDPTTGNVTGADTNVTVKGVITRVNPRESEGLYQTTDLKVIIGTAELGTYYPTEADRIQYDQAGVTREAKIIAITSYRGDNPVLHTLIARPQ
jgi:hypothetical protein